MNNKYLNVFNTVLLLTISYIGMAAAQDNTELPEFRNKSFSFQELAGKNADGSHGIGEQKGVTRRDPSDVLKVDDTYYVWYSKVVHDEVDEKEEYLKTSGYAATLWYATSKDEGHTWKEQGEALGVGRKGSFDGQAVFTPNILEYQDKYYLYYTGVKHTPGLDYFENNSTNDFTNIGLAVADSPDGPFRRVSSKPILTYNPDGTSFDSYRVDDASLLIRNGKIWLYYKGRNLADGRSGPAQTKMGVAFADKPEGLYKKYEGNPILDKSHEVFIWAHRQGVAAYASLSKTLEYEPDGLDFATGKAGIRTLPKPNAPGAYRRELTERLKKGPGVEWGISMRHGPNPYLVRWGCDLSVPNADQSEK